MSENLLPPNWITLPLSEVIQTQKGKKPHNLGEKSELRTIPYINIKAFEKGIVTEYAPEQEAVFCTEQDVLLVWDGARAGLSGRGISGYVGSTLAKVTSDLVEINFLSYFFESIYRTLNTQTKGVGIPHINPVVLNSLPFNLAPTNEQTRVVDKLEELFSELDAGVNELKAAQTKLSQYRQSLLKSAVEGSLTEQWRAENSAQVQETGEQLLARILKQRREQWQQQKLSEFAEKGKTPPKGWQDKYPEPVQPDTSELPELPVGWVWASIAQLGHVQLGRQRTPSKMKGDNPTKYIRAANITEQGINFNDVLEMDFTEREVLIYQLQAGDLLLTEASGSPEHVGRPCIWPEVDGVYCFQNTVIRFQPSVIGSDFSFLTFYAYQKLGKYIDVSGGVGINHLSAGKFSKIAVPLPPLVEQYALVEEITNEFDSIYRQLETTKFGLKQSEAQRKNILKSAFSGQLVPQDPNDEPASVLLEKIKQEREALAKKPKTKQIKTKSAMKKITVEELTKWVSDYEGNSFTFGELQKTFQGDYDQLKDCVFEILSAKEPILKQVFDKKLTAITFIKEDK